MSTVLATAIDAVQRTFIVNGSDAFDINALPNRVTVGSEAMYVHAVEPLRSPLNRLSVTRGADRTTPATHVIASAMTSTPVGSSGGGSSVIGPFAVAWNDVGVAVDGEAIGPALSAGTMVLRAWLFVTNPWLGDSGNDFSIGAGADTGHWEEMFTTSQAKVNQTATKSDTQNQNFSAILLPTGGTLVFYAEQQTAGAANIYALIWTPA